MATGAPAGTSKVMRTRSTPSCTHLPRDSGGAPPLSRRTLLVQAGLALAALGLRRAVAQPAAAPPEGDRKAKLVDDLVAANRILVDQGVLDGYGHVSVRHPGDANRYLMSRSLAPELVTAADVLEHDLDGAAPDAPGAGLYLERFLHCEIYRARRDVNAIVHSHAPSLIPFGATGVPLRPLYHMSAFLAAGVPVFDIRAVAGASDMLVRTSALGRALAQALGSHAVALMRGHGAVVVGPDLPHAVFRSVYTEVNARLQAQAMALGKKVTYLDPEEARRAEAALDGTLARPWELWRRKALPPAR
jgi:HCOMODA/2-hydroxy-3-carboxy-muconic semialdehyde decarboxylase